MMYSIFLMLTYVFHPVISLKSTQLICTKCMEICIKKCKFKITKMPLFVVFVDSC